MPAKIKFLDIYLILPPAPALRLLGRTHNTISRGPFKNPGCSVENPSYGFLLLSSGFNPASYVSTLVIPTLIYG